MTDTKYDNTNLETVKRIREQIRNALDEDPNGQWADRVMVSISGEDILGALNDEEYDYLVSSIKEITSILHAPNEFVIIIFTYSAGDHKAEKRAKQINSTLRYDLQTYSPQLDTQDKIKAVAIPGRKSY